MTQFHATVDEIAETVDDILEQTTDTASKRETDERTTESTGSEPVALTPVVSQNEPSSRLKIDGAKLDEDTDIVKVSHDGTEAYFYVDPVSDAIIDSIGNKIKLHENVAGLFDGIDRSKEMSVDPTVGDQDIHACDSVMISTDEFIHTELASFLREHDYLLHPIQEIVPAGSGHGSFTVVDMEPAGYTTLRVTENTEITFTD